MYLEFSWSLFFRIQAKYGDLSKKFLYSIPLQEKTYQKKSEYRPFFGSDNRTDNNNENKKSKKVKKVCHKKQT